MLHEDIKGILSGLTKDTKKVDSALKELLALFSKAGKGREFKDITKDGITYRYCSWSRAYFPLDEFVGTEGNKKNYTRKAYKIWYNCQKAAEKLRIDAANKLATKEIELEEFRSMIDEADATAALKDNPSTYQEVTAQGIAPEDLM